MKTEFLDKRMKKKTMRLDPKKLISFCIVACTASLLSRKIIDHGANAVTYMSIFPMFQHTSLIKANNMPSL